MREACMYKTMLHDECKHQNFHLLLCSCFYNSKSHPAAVVTKDWWQIQGIQSLGHNILWMCCLQYFLGWTFWLLWAKAEQSRTFGGHSWQQATKGNFLPLCSESLFHLLLLIKSCPWPSAHDQWHSLSFHDLKTQWLSWQQERLLVWLKHERVCSPTLSCTMLLLASPFESIFSRIMLEHSLLLHC